MFKKILNLFITDKKEISSSNVLNQLDQHENFYDVDKNCISKDRHNRPCLFKSNEKVNLDDYQACKWVERWKKKLPDFDKEKPTILIVDDNLGIISFLMDDLESLDEDCDTFNLDDYNVITFSTAFAAFEFIVTQHYYQGLNIKYAILDLTLGGSITTLDGPIKYTGIDIYQQILLYDPDAKVLFYTGNSLNEYVTSSKQMIEQFHKISNKNILDYVLFKTAYDLEGRRNFLKKWLMD